MSLLLHSSQPNQHHCDQHLGNIMNRILLLFAVAVLCAVGTAAPVAAQNRRTINQRTLEFPNNFRPSGFTDRNFRPLGFDPPPIRYPAATYSLDSLRSHPYNPRSAAAFGSLYAPRFRPGFGYQSPYGRLRSPEYNTLNPYHYEYGFGVRQGYFNRNSWTHQYWTNSYGGPWYFPGSTTNTQRRFSW